MPLGSGTDNYPEVYQSHLSRSLARELILILKQENGKLQDDLSSLEKFQDTWTQSSR